MFKVKAVQIEVMVNTKFLCWEDAAQFERRARKPVWLELSKWVRVVRVVRTAVRVRLQRTFGIMVRTVQFILSKMGTIKDCDKKVTVCNFYSKTL